MGSKAPSFEAQVPPTQVERGPQDLPHVPQLFESVLVSAQPVEQQVWLGRQAGPLLQVVGATHSPITQESAGAQGWPQPPQFSGSLVVSEQPVGQHSWPPVQAGPPLQVGMHTPAEQLLPDGQTWPHFPQLFESVEREEQPVLQHSPAEHTGPPLQVQLPLTHDSNPEQSWPQAPQLVASVIRSEQPFGQHCSVAVQNNDSATPHEVTMLHTGAQVPSLHPSPAAQALPHDPQFCTSRIRVEQPVLQQVSRLASQPGPPLQTPQPPLMQLTPGTHSWVQTPQLLGSVVVSVSQPLAAMPSQSAKPGAQPSTAQVPETHFAAMARG
jgi:hypothetical protein